MIGRGILFDYLRPVLGTDAECFAMVRDRLGPVNGSPEDRTEAEWESFNPVARYPDDWLNLRDCEDK